MHSLCYAYALCGKNAQRGAVASRGIPQYFHNSKYFKFCGYFFLIFSTLHNHLTMSIKPIAAVDKTI